MRPIFLFVLTLSFGFQAKAQLVDDFEVINVQLAEFEKKGIAAKRYLYMRQSLWT